MATQYVSEGEPGRPPMLFIHGWPDSGTLWRKQVRHFAQSHYCCCVHLPLYHAWPDRTYDFPRLAELLRETLDEILAESGQPRAIVVGHDWGAVLAYMLEQRCPEKISALVTMDVGADFKPETLPQLLFMVMYQGWLIAAFFLGRIVPPVGRLMTGVFMRVAKAPRDEPFTSDMNYPYVYFWRAVLAKKWRGSLPREYQPQRPILYLYGERKYFHFHNAHWLETVRNTPGSRVVAMESCDHWLMVREPAKTNATIEEWLASLTSSENTSL